MIMTTAPQQAATGVEDALTLVLDARRSNRITAREFLADLQLIESQYGVALSEMTTLIFPAQARIRVAGGKLN